MDNKLVPIALAYTLPLALATLLGLGCVSCVSCTEDSAAACGIPTTELEFKSYVTPDCPQVVETLRAILGDPPYRLSQAGLDGIRDWVASNIEYKADEARWGEDYWQTPEMTLHLGGGDCEDFSILLCSLLRAYGINAELVYVAIGVNECEEQGHAFVIEDWNCDGEWHRIESQAPSHLPSPPSWFTRPQPHPDSQLKSYQIDAAFNDVYYYGESFPWGAR